jgi:hypothetical protein
MGRYRGRHRAGCTEEIACVDHRPHLGWRVAERAATAVAILTGVVRCVEVVMHLT